MQIHHDLDAMIPRPANDAVEVLFLSVDPGLAIGNVIRPVPYRYANVVQTGLYIVSSYPQGCSISAAK